MTNTNYRKSNTLRALKLLRLVPDDIILSIATRDFNMIDGASCLCGWVVRETLARIRNVPIHTSVMDSIAPESMCCELYGGDRGDWEDVFAGVMRDETELEWSPNRMNLIDVELALITRLNEIVDAD